MKKTILLASLVLGGIVSAQNNNEELKKQLQERREKTNVEYDFYTQKQLSQLSTKDKNYSAKRNNLRSQLENKKSTIAFFFDGRPYFRHIKDRGQISNANVDYLQEGKVEGLDGSFNGEGIKIAVFDGGRAYEKHDDFGGATSTRISNKETTSEPYDSHATGVTGMIGAQGHTLTFSDGSVAGNTKGMMPLATFDNYSFFDTILEGETEKKDVFQKILGSLPNLSNHSYGVTNGWMYNYAEDGYPEDGWYWNSRYSRTSKEYYSLEGTYSEEDIAYDDIVYNNPSVIIAKAAGNEFGDGPRPGDKKFYERCTSSGCSYRAFDDASDVIPPNNCSEGYDCLSSGSLAKNIIVVAATEKINGDEGRYSQASDVVRAYYSSVGPRDDGGIKPDIAGVGSNILYPSTSDKGSTEWGLGDGTSYSTPQVTGILGLWTEINRKLFGEDFNAASAKTLLIHSAQEAGNVGPDAQFGWGFADAKAGAELLVQKVNEDIIFEDKTLKNGSTDNILVETDGKQPLKVSISWIDPSFKNLPTSADAYNNRTSVLVNDLDLRITNVETGEVFFPWKLDINNPLAPATKGDNLVDNVEQVLIDTPKAGTYKIEVSHKKSLLNNNGESAGSQNYSILATGYTNIISEQEYFENIDNAKYAPLIAYPAIVTEENNIVKVDHPDKVIESVSVYNMAGRLIMSEKVTKQPHSLDFSNLARDMYIIDAKLKNSTETISRKILKR